MELIARYRYEVLRRYVLVIKVESNYMFCICGNFC